MREHGPWMPAAAEYFRDFTDGRYIGDAEMWLILPKDQAYIDLERHAFVIGSAGCDGIIFCFRRHHEGVWAFYPIDEEWVLVAPNLAALERGWNAGDISV